jgi:DNA-binding NarL/FixJ family response regulator
VLLREGLIGVLSRFGFDVVAAVGTAVELLDAVATHQPDLVVTDIRMPPGDSDDGLRAAVALRNNHPDLAVLVLSRQHLLEDPHVVIQGDRVLHLRFKVRR